MAESASSPSPPAGFSWAASLRARILPTFDPTSWVAGCRHGRSGHCTRRRRRWPVLQPRGIAFALASSLSLSASVYGLVSGTQKDGLSTGHDFTFSDINTFPVSTSAVFKWGPRAEPDGAPVNALAVSIFVPESEVLDDRRTAGAETEFRTMSEQTIWAGMTYARRFGRLGLGVSGYVLIGTSTASLDYNSMNSANSSDFFVVDARTDQTVVVWSAPSAHATT